MRTTDQPAVRETVERMDQGWAEFRRMAHAMPAARWCRRGCRAGPDGWTRKEMLAHVGTWHELTVDALHELVQKGEIPDRGGETDEINARAARSAAGRTAGEVLFNLDDSYRDVQRSVSRLTDAQLALHDGWAAAMIAGNTYGHYAEHTADLGATAHRKA